MTTRAVAVVVLTLLTGGVATAQSIRRDSRRPPFRTIGQTTIVGESDARLWKQVLDLLPTRPRRIEVLDVDSLSDAARQKVRGLDAFVLAGHATVVVIRQGATLRQAEFGDGVDRLALAALVWHELAHANGLNEHAAIEQEEALWRRFISTGLVEAGMGRSYVARLREVGASERNSSEGRHGRAPDSSNEPGTNRRICSKGEQSLCDQ